MDDGSNEDEVRQKAEKLLLMLGKRQQVDNNKIITTLLTRFYVGNGVGRVVVIIQIVVRQEIWG